MEFAGYPFDTDKEINGVTFGSVGSGTQVDHIQVSYSNDDSFEWFGGSVNCSNLVAFKGWDDDFDTDNGFNGTVQYCLSIRDPRIADTSQSNGFESDNNASGAETTPFTTATFKNVTFIGPMTAKNADFATKSEDRSQKSFSHTFFLSNPSNKVMAENELRLSAPLNVGQNYCPAAMLSDGKGGYVGAFKDASDNWMSGWTNFDLQNTNY